MGFFSLSSFKKANLRVLSFQVSFKLKYQQHWNEHFDFMINYLNKIENIAKDSSTWRISDIVISAWTSKGLATLTLFTVAISKGGVMLALYLS